MIILESCSHKMAKEERAIFGHFQELGRENEIIQLSLKQLRRNKFEGLIMDYDLVSGSLPFVETAFKQMGYVDNEDCYPGSLNGFLHRKISVTSKLFLNPYRFPVFIKPKLTTKAFTGFVARDIDDYRLNYVKPNIPLYVSEVVEWVSEWRFYVLDPFRVVKAHYDGNGSISPDPDIVKEILGVVEAKKLFPSVLDLGVLSNGKTALIEVNPAYSVGLYMPDAHFYTNLLLSKWREIKIRSLSN